MKKHNESLSTTAVLTALTESGAIKTGKGTVPAVDLGEKASKRLQNLIATEVSESQDQTLLDFIETKFPSLFPIVASHLATTVDHQITNGADSSQTLGSKPGQDQQEQVNEVIPVLEIVSFLVENGVLSTEQQTVEEHLHDVYLIESKIRTAVDVATQKHFDFSIKEQRNKRHVIVEFLRVFMPEEFKLLISRLTNK